MTNITKTANSLIDIAASNSLSAARNSITKGFGTNGAGKTTALIGKNNAINNVKTKRRFQAAKQNTTKMIGRIYQLSSLWCRAQAQSINANLLRLQHLSYVTF
ncbi:hypothetical protein [Loktanella sp. S4079]|uniref:hypothetical protein n=1 Tax=Loktanella sp. S4079 TaxID=579483 RepID=UPI0012EE4B7E|nr:hypothetical protein [Loktanella sp. S4079]